MQEAQEHQCFLQSSEAKRSEQRNCRLNFETYSSKVVSLRLENKSLFKTYDIIFFKSEEIFEAE